MTKHVLPAEIRPPTGAIFHIAFYKFVLLDDPDGVVAQLRLLTENLLGSILVASEGINGMLAGDVVALDAFQDALIGEDYFAGKFVGIAFKRTQRAQAIFCWCPSGAATCDHDAYQIDVSVEGGGLDEEHVCKAH